MAKKKRTVGSEIAEKKRFLEKSGFNRGTGIERGKPKRKKPAPRKRKRR